MAHDTVGRVPNLGARTYGRDGRTWRTRSPVREISCKMTKGIVRDFRILARSLRRSRSRGDACVAPTVHRFLRRRLLGRKSGKTEIRKDGLRLCRIRRTDG